mgnify:CR=1 FL=1
MKTDIYEKITNAIIAQIEGTLDGEYRTPWISLGGVNYPTSIAGRQYRGVNVFMLSMTAAAKNYSTGVWGTYKAWKKIGAQVQKGERGTSIVFWQRINKETINDTGEKEQSSFMFAKGYSVFNAAQVTGYEPPENKVVLNDHDLIENCETLVADYFKREKCTLEIGGDVACFIPAQDTVKVPLPGQFKDIKEYYSTTFHEMGHSTGHKSRLDRDLRNRFGSQAYAAEELIAELTSAMTCGIMGIEDTPREDHAKYLKHWLQLLKDDKKAIFTAASKAQKATDYITGYEYQEAEKAA